MTTTNHNIQALLAKTEHYDKDERYMATSDLCEVLKRTRGGDGGSTSQQGLDPTTERKICTAVLRLLHDKSNDVQALAVKTLGVLLTTVQEELVLEIADSLADQVLDASKSELRDVYSIGLRTLVQTIPPKMGDPTSKRLVSRLLEGIRGNEQEIVLSCLDILTDLLTRFGGTATSLTRQLEPVLTMCLDQIQNAKAPAVRKRVGTTIGCLSVVLSDALLVSMVERLLGQLHQSEQGNASAEEQRNNARALIRTMCTVSGAVGHRLQQPQIDRIIPIFLQFCRPEDATTGGDGYGDYDEEGNNMDEDEDGANTRMMFMQDEAGIALANELRESCFMGFESFVLRCPTQVQPHLDNIIQAALAYMSYDPNYSYGSDTEEGGDKDGDNDGDDMGDDDYDDGDDQYSEGEDDEEDDDDDESWKVRRSAIRALKAVVECQKHDPAILWTKKYPTRQGHSAVIAMALLNRFKEREENCRVGVLDCFTRLLAVTIEAANSGVIALQDATASMESTSSSVTIIDVRTTYAPALVKACEKLLSVKKGGELSKSHALALLSILCKAPGGVGGQTEILAVFSHIQSFMAMGAGGGNDHHDRDASSKTIRLDALSLAHAMLACGNHEPASIRKGLLQSLLPELGNAVQEQWYKVIAEALRALSVVPRYFTVGYGGSDEMADTHRVAKEMYTAVEPLLAAHDVDQEIKECALTAVAALLSNLFPSLSPEQTSRLLGLLLERLKNETTRIAAIKTISEIAAAASSSSSSSTPLDLSPILGDSIVTMSGFLKLQSRSLKQSALRALDIVLTNHGTADAQDLYALVLQDLAPLVVDSDLHSSHLALRVAISALKVCPGCGPAVREHVLPKVLVLSTSPLLQDLALDSLLTLVKEIITSDAVGFLELLSLLRQSLSEAGTSKHSIENLARCMATITAATTAEYRQGVISETLSTLQGSSTPEDPTVLKQVQLSLLMSGDLGRIVNLNADATGIAEQFLVIYMGYFESPSEDLKNAAAYALGRAAVGAQSVFLPDIVEGLESNSQKKQYLLLSALRAFIQCSYQQSGGEAVAASLPLIMPHLENHCGDKDEGVRTMVAECMGSLACMQPGVVLEKLSQLLDSHSNITAVNGTIDPSDEVSKMNSLVCWTITTSVKLAIAGKADPSQVAVFMPRLLTILTKEEIGCCHAALLMAYSATHHMPQVVASLMKDQILPFVFEFATFKLERTVDLGPFKHKVDVALPLRKTALSMFSSCLEHLPGSLDIGSFMPVLALALNDVEDIQLQAHQIVMSMCVRHPTYIVAAIESLVDPLETTMRKKAGPKTGTELERFNEWIKSAVRTMVVLSKLEGVMNNRKFADFLSRTRANSKFESMLEAIGAER